MAQVARQHYEEAVPVGSLNLHPRNARQGDVGLIHDSIEEDDFYGACIVQRSTRRVIAGNHRLMAARQAGLSHLPVIWVDCDDDRALRMLLVDNKASDGATYNTKDLAALLSELQQNTDDGLTGTGFSDDELEDLLKSLIPSTIETSDDGLGGGDEGPGGQHALLILCDGLMDQDEICSRLSSANVICRKVVVTEETLTALGKTSPKTPRKRKTKVDKTKDLRKSDREAPPGDTSGD